MLKKFILLLTLCRAFSLGAVCNPYALPTYLTGLVPFTIVNNSGSVASSDLYVTIVGTDPTSSPVGKSCIVQLTSVGGNWVGSLVDAALNTNTLDYSYQVSQFPLQNGQPVIYLPPITNATMYLSIDYGMGLNVSYSPLDIQPPALFDTVDGNYYHLYDSSVFFSIGTELNFQSQYNTAFGLPISAIISINGGSSVQYAGIQAKRTKIFNNFSNAVTNISQPNNSQAEWAKLPLSFTSASGGGPTQLRLASTLSAMNFATDSFDTTYLQNAAQYGVNWAQTVFDPAPSPLYLDVSALANGYTTYQYMGVSGGMLTFSPNGAGSAVTIPYPFSSSLPFLNAAPIGPDSFQASGDGKASPIICSYLSAGFVSGLFPVSTSATNPFGNNYLAFANVYGELYQTTPPFTSSTGPWYDLYGKILHTTAGTPYFNFETDAVDTNLGYFAPVIVKNTSQTQPAVFVVLNDLGSTVIPNFTDSTMYNVLIAYDSNVTVNLNGSPAPHSQTSVNIPFTLEITYLNGHYSGLTYTSQVWLNDSYSVVFPQPPAAINPMNMSTFWNIGVGDSP